jgi:hypothetical protein
MVVDKSIRMLRIWNLISFIIMVGINALANIVPINGITTGEVSDSYPNLFAPAGITFAIWGLIYLLLAAFSIYQLGLFKKNNTTAIVKTIGSYFIISSLANAIWIFSWHYKMIPLSVLLMLVILICLIIINLSLNKQKLSFNEKLFVRLPFSVYFGWITVATIANITTLLVSLGWKGSSSSEQLWTIIVIAVGAVIGMATILKLKDIAYGLVIIWAFVGILIKHMSTNGFDGSYPAIINSVIVSIVFLASTILYVLYRIIKNRPD